MDSIAPAILPTQPGSLRRLTGRRRPYPAEIVAAARALIEGTGLRFDEIAERIGVGAATVGRWARRGGWTRPGKGGEARRTCRSSTGRTSDPPACVIPMSAEGSSRSTLDRRASFETVGSADLLRMTSASVPRASFAAADRVPRRGRYGPVDHEAARALIEGSRLSRERIGIELGIGGTTLFHWQKRFRWRRPAAPERPGPQFYRYRLLRGRPYAADAVGIAQRLVTGTLLSQASIAAQAGVSVATVSRWTSKRGWTRPPAKPWSHRFAASRRTAPVATSGDRRGRCYAPQVVAAARELYEQTALSTALIAARVKVSAVTVERWARVKGWTRPRDLPDPSGRRGRPRFR